MGDLTKVLTGNPVPVDEVTARREAFKYANATNALEGLVADAEQLALQEEVIQGRITTEEMYARIRERYGVPNGDNE